MIQIDFEKYNEADLKLHSVSQAADALTCIADSLEREGEESYVANAVHFAADFITTAIEEIRELLFG